MSDAAQQPGILPPGWARATIGNLVSKAGVFCDGDWVESRDQDPSGDVRLIQLADVGDGQYRDRSHRFLTSEKAKELNCTLLNPGDVLIARMPDPLGRACIFPGDSKLAVTVVDVCIVRTGVPEIDHRWLQWFINAHHFRVQIAGLQSGSTRKRISRGNLSTLCLPVPPSGEQRRIVAKIEELFSDLDAGVAALERVRANLKRYRAAVLKAAVEGRLTEEWRKRNPVAPEDTAAKLLERILLGRRAKWEQDQLRKFKEAGKAPPKGWKEKYEEPQASGGWDGAKLPRTWTLGTIDQLSVVVRGGSPRPAGDPKYFNGTHTPWITVGSLTADESIYLRAVSEYLTEAGRERSRYIEPDTLLLTNSGATLGVPKITMIGGCINDGSVALLGVDYPLKLYLHFFLKSQTQRLRGLNQGAAQPNLNTGIVKAVVVPLPPSAEQSAIVAEVDHRLSVADAAEQQVEHALQRAARLRQSILKRAFEGRLVPQDPTDEPAAKMLDRTTAATNGHRAVIETSRTPRRDTSKRRSRARA